MEYKHGYGQQNTMYQELLASSKQFEELFRIHGAPAAGRGEET